MLFLSTEVQDSIANIKISVGYLDNIPLADDNFNTQDDVIVE